jgi:predicted permease
MEFPINIVSPRYFETLQMNIVEGRDFSDADAARAPAVAIVNDELARRYFGGDALGRRMRDSNDRQLEIVGVVRTGRYRSLQELSPAPMVYYPLAQAYAGRMLLVTRTGADPAKFLEGLRKTLRSADGRIAIYRTLTMDSHLTEVFATDRLAAALVGTCGVMAAVLAMVGVYGVMAYAVSLRTSEIGVRLALGAPRRHVLRLVVRDGVLLTALGCAAGVLGAAASTRLVRSMLFGVSSLDPWAFTFAPAALAVVAMMATLVPARRALHIDPMTVLRRE